LPEAKNKTVSSDNNQQQPATKGQLQEAIKPPTPEHGGVYDNHHSGSCAPSFLFVVEYQSGPGQLI
jgi:hypothetical protein